MPRQGPRRRYRRRHSQYHRRRGESPHNIELAQLDPIEPPPNVEFDPVVIYAVGRCLVHARHMLDEATALLEPMLRDIAACISGVLRNTGSNNNNNYNDRFTDGRPSELVDRLREEFIYLSSVSTTTDRILGLMEADGARLIRLEEAVSSWHLAKNISIHVKALATNVEKLKKLHEEYEKAQEPNEPMKEKKKSYRVNMASVFIYVILLGALPLVVGGLGNLYVQISGLILAILQDPKLIVPLILAPIKASIQARGHQLGCDIATGGLAAHFRVFPAPGTRQALSESEAKHAAAVFGIE